MTLFETIITTLLYDLLAKRNIKKADQDPNMVQVNNQRPRVLNRSISE